MIIRLFNRLTLRPLKPLISPISRYNFSILNYQAPPSRLQQFIQNITKIHDQNSFKRAAQLLATLQADKELYLQKLKDLDDQLLKYNQTEQQVIRVLNIKKTLEQQIKAIEEENQSIVKRSIKEIQNIKIYGIAKIAKEIIEVADHLAQAIEMCEKEKSKGKEVKTKQLYKINQEFLGLLKKYEIYPVCPTNEYFNPNQHHSIAHIDSDDPTKSNLVAQTKRIGWKLKNRVLRQAYVVIYK